MTAMHEYLEQPHRFVTAEQHTLLLQVDAAGALRLPAGPGAAVNPLLQRGLVARQRSQAVALTVAGRSVLHALNERN